MPISTRQQFHYTGDWSGYMHVEIDMGVEITLNDARDNLHVHIYDWNTQCTGSSLTGYGFINIVLLGWDFPQVYNEEPDPDDQGPETWDEAWGQVLEALPNVNDYLMWGVGMSDEGTPPDIEQYIQGTFDHDYPLTPDDFVNGQLRDMTIINSISRFRGNGEDYPADTSFVVSSDAFSFSLSSIPWPYYPNAVYQGGQFVSCNSEGNDFMRYSGDWQAVQNDLYNNADSSNHFQYFNGSGWVKTPLIGA